MPLLLSSLLLLALLLTASASPAVVRAKPPDGENVGWATTVKWRRPGRRTKGRRARGTVMKDETEYLPRVAGRRTICYCCCSE